MKRLPITWPSVIPPASTGNKNPNEPFDFVEQGRMLSARTREELIKKITDFRAGNGYEVGDVALEVDRYTAAKTGAPVQVVKPQLKELGKTWLARKAGEIAKGQVKFVSEDETARRALICMSCPMNQKVPTGCMSCEANEERLVTILTHGRAKARDGLNYCENFKFVLPLAVHLEKDQETDNTEAGKQNAPAACWNR